jgi:hypothetical protein
MIKPISIAALQKFFFMARIILLVVSIGQRREAPPGNVAEQPAWLSGPIVRIPA